VTVTTPTGEKLPVKSDTLRRALEAHSGRELFLLYDYRGSYDVAPISLISRQTITRIAEESETRDDPVRFRPNLVNGREETYRSLIRVLRSYDTHCKRPEGANYAGKVP